MQPFERVSVSRRFLGPTTLLFEILRLDADSVAGVGFFPYLRISPVIIRIGRVDDGEESRIINDPVADLEGVVMDFATDRIFIETRRGDRHHQWLPPRSSARCQSIPEFPIRLTVQLIENDPVGVETVLRLYVGAQDLVAACGLRNDDGTPIDLRTLAERRVVFDHFLGDLKHDRSLLTVCRGTIDLCTLFLVSNQQVQPYSCRQGRLT